MTIALIGINGLLGPDFLETFTDPKFNTQPLIVVTREPSKHKSTDKVEYAAFSDLDKVVERADVLVALHTANPELYSTVYKALAQPKNNVKLYFPATWGFDDSIVQKYLPGLLKFRADHIIEARKLGIKTVATFTGLFATPSGLLFDFAFQSIGLDDKTGTATYRGSGKEQLNISFPVDIAHSVAELIKKPISQIPDEFIIYSDTITPRDVVAQFTKRHPEVTITEKEIDLNKETAVVAEKIQSGQFDFLGEALPVIVGHGVDGGLAYSKSHRDLVNPNGSVWSWGSYATRGK